MNLDDLGWRGKKVRNLDGRTGVIRGENEACGYCTLTIKVGDGSLDEVTLNSEGKDFGSLGWEWYCENFDSGARWLRLGDHNPESE